MTEQPATERPALRLPVGEITVLLGDAALRHRVLDRLDAATPCCAGGHPLPGGVLRVGVPATAELTDRLHLLLAARGVRPAFVLVDRLTDGLSTVDRRTVLTALRAVAADGVAVLVDDEDPVAVLAVAGTAVRVHPDGRITVEPLEL